MSQETAGTFSEAERCCSDRSSIAQRIAVAVVERDGCYLIGQRRPDVSQGGLWEFPGGKIESGESPEEAAVRECREETGVVVQAVGSHGTVVHRYDAEGAAAPRTLEIHFVACQLARADVVAAAPYRWVAASTLCDYPFPAANASLIARLAGTGR